MIVYNHEIPCDIPCDIPWSSLTAGQPALSRSGFWRTSCKAWQCSVVSELLDTNSFCTAETTESKSLELSRIWACPNLLKDSSGRYKYLVSLHISSDSHWSAADAVVVRVNITVPNMFFQGPARPAQLCDYFSIFGSTMKHWSTQPMSCSGCMFELLGWVRDPAGVEVHPTSWSQ